MNQIPSCVCTGDRLIYKLSERDDELYYSLVCRYCQLVIYLEKVNDYSSRKKKDEYFYDEKWLEGNDK